MNRERRGLHLIAAVVLASSMGVVRVDAQEPGWERLRQEQGIALSTRHEPGRKTATFRAIGEVSGSLWHVLAVVMDDVRAKQWATAADESKVLRVVDGRTQIVYSRSHQTWPVRDRDLVMQRRLERLAPGELRVRLTCVTGEKPEVSSVVRIRDCETTFLLRKLDEQRTLVEFRMRADAGAGPEWLTKLAAQGIPLDTLKGLRAQIDKTRGRYGPEIEALQRAR